ncbi:hypothetical protein ES703_20688 [subsurface metagenome]
MTHDYPDHTRLMHLVGTEITIPISIEASEVTIPVSIAASDITLNVYLGSLPLETTAENLLTNPGFETGDFTGWTQFYATIVDSPPERVYKGTYSVLLATHEEVEAYVLSSLSIPCYPGQRLQVAAAMWAVLGVAHTRLAVEFRTAEDEYLQRDDGPDYGGGYAWTPKSATFLVPDGAAFARVGAVLWADGGPAHGGVDSFIAARLVQPGLDSSLNLDINIVAQEIEALKINITAAEITINMSFTDQSVAVFDAAKWFAHQAAQVFVLGSDSADPGVFVAVATRVVTGGTKYFMTVASGGYNGTANAHVAGYLDAGGTTVMRFDGTNGFDATFDTPIRADGAIVVTLYMAQWSEANAQMVGGFGGYDEA